LSCVDTGFTVSRYGIYTGRFDGSGEASIEAFRTGLQTLLDNASLRAELGTRGRAWVSSLHTVDSFVAHFDKLVTRAGLER
jgi:hypothetical protein